MQPTRQEEIDIVRARVEAVQARIDDEGPDTYLQDTLVRLLYWLRKYDPSERFGSNY